MIDNQPTSRSESDQMKACHCWQVLLGLVCSFCISVLLGLGIYYQTALKTASPTEIPQRATPPCLSPACLQAAARLSAVADPFAQPCDYFLARCREAAPAATTRGRQRGKQIAKEKKGLEELVPLDRATEAQTNTDNVPDKLADKKTALLQALREILESPDWPSSAGQKVHTFYRSCMDTEAIENVGSRPVLKLIQKLGGWAVSGNWNHTDFNFTLSLLMKEYSTFPFFRVYVGKDRNDSGSSGQKMYIQIDQPEFQIPLEWDSKIQKSKMKPETIRQFLKFHLDLLALLGQPSSSTNKHTGRFLQLLSQLTQATSPMPYRLEQQLLYQHMTVKELQAVAPAIDWLGCLQATFHPLPISQSEVVLLHNLPYIIHMSRTISKWQSSPELSDSGQIHTFMILSLLHKVIPALNSKFAEIQRHLSEVLGDTVEDIPRWEKCVLEAEKGFDTVLTALIKERVGEKEAQELMQDIYSSLKSRISKLKWTNKELRSSILNRVGSLTPRLSMNKEILSQTKIDQHYSEVAVSEDNYFSNYLQSLSLQQKRRNTLFSQTTTHDILSFMPSLSGEEINIPLGMFVPPFFHPSYPRAVNYGILGTLMAKEILYLLLPDIQSQSEEPKKISDCVWAHYLHLTEGSYRTDSPPLTPAQQQAVWAQHTALHVALQAYNQSLLRNHGDTSLSSLSHTHLFLASFAQNNCDSDPFNQRLPFEPFFLVTVICMNSDLCPKPMTCSHSSQEGYSQKC